MKNNRWFSWMLAGMLASSSLLTTTACEKEDDDDPITSTTPIVAPLTVDVQQPTAGATFGLGETVPIEVVIKSTEELHGYEFYLRNTSQNNTVVMEDHVHTHGTTIRIQESWVNNVTDHSDMELEVVAYGDHDGSTHSHKVSFHCHPM